MSERYEKLRNDFGAAMGHWQNPHSVFGSGESVERAQAALDEYVERAEKLLDEAAERLKEATRLVSYAAPINDGRGWQVAAHDWLTRYHTTRTEGSDRNARGTE